MHPQQYYTLKFVCFSLVIYALVHTCFSWDLSQQQTVRPGGKITITNQTLIQDLSNFLVSNSSQNEICSVQRVINPQQQIVAGTLYFMTVQISVIKPGSGFSQADCGTIDPSNLQVICEQVKIFKPLNSQTYQLEEETVVTCPA